VLGATGAVELTHDVDLDVATRVALDHGVWIRPFGTLIYAMPPYVCTVNELDQVAEAIVAATKAVA
jgi:adenosylmethionine-8-amino-7-oxononanoate aminotransferase